MIDGNFIPKEDIAYWCPVTREMEFLIDSLMMDSKLRDGYHPKKFQMIEQCIRDKAKERNIAEYTGQPKQNFVVGNKK